MKDEAAEVSSNLFLMGEALDRWVLATKTPAERKFWDAMVGQIDTIAMLIAEEDEVCDGCGVRRAEDIELFQGEATMFCAQCRVADAAAIKREQGWVDG